MKCMKLAFENPLFPHARTLIEPTRADQGKNLLLLLSGLASFSFTPYLFISFPFPFPLSLFPKLRFKGKDYRSGSKHVLKSPHYKTY